MALSGSTHGSSGLTPDGAPPATTSSTRSEHSALRRR
jgi:hypothetical protein